MIKAGNVVRCAHTSVLLLMAVSLVACSGDSTTEPGDSGPFYTVGGTVTGVTSGGILSISNRVNQQLDNQKNRMSLQLNTAYIFSRTVVSGDTYQVVVEADPLNQRCTVSNGAGLAVGNVSNVNIHCITPPQYSVGGSVTGLNGVLTLRINGAVEETVSADGAYTFPTMMSGSDYHVAVYDEPANQDCTVTNAIGTLSSPVNNVNVSCTSDDWVHPAHLAVNISPDGEDAVSPQIAMDDNGNAIVVWQQHDGNLDTDDLPISQVYMSEYRAGVWTHPANLADHISVAGQNAVAPQVAMGRDQTDTYDEAVIVWSQKDSGGNNSQLFMSEYRADVWSHPVGLTSASYINPTGSSIFEASTVAMDDLGNAIIAWTQFSGVGAIIDSPQLYVSEYRGGSWVHPVSRSADTFSQTGRPVRFAPGVAMSNNGEAVVVWRQHSGTSQGAFLAHRRDYRSGVWSAVPDPFFSVGDTITPVQSGNISGMKVAMDENGNSIIVWDQVIQEAQPHPYFPGPSPVAITHVFKSEYRDWGAPGPANWFWADPVNPFDNISPAGLSVQNPDVVMNDSGQVMITWLQEDDSRKQRIFKSEFSGGVWDHPANLADNFRLGDGGIANYDVALADNGDAVIVWRQFDGFKFSAYKSEYRVSVAEWQHPISVADAISSEVSVPTDCDSSDVNCLPATVGGAPVVAMDNPVVPGVGDTLIFWSQLDSESTPVTRQIFKSELR